MAEGVVVGAAFAQDGEVVGDAGQVGAGPLIPDGFVRVVLVGALDGFGRAVERAVAEGLLHEAQPRQRDARGVDLAELETVERLVGGGVDAVIGLGPVGRGDVVNEERGSRLRDGKTGCFLLGAQTALHFLKDPHALRQAPEGPQRRALLQFPDQRVVGIVLGGRGRQGRDDLIIARLIRGARPRTLRRVGGAPGERGDEDGKEESQTRMNPDWTVAAQV